nr:hypothetical protein [Bacteroidales bacterium]
MKTINFNHRDNENLNTEDFSEIAKRTARIMEQHANDNVMSVDANGELIDEICENEKDSVEWCIVNVNYNDDDNTIKSVDID